MVEGHSVHRVASAHRRHIGKRFKAVSPNKRFTAGAKAINNRVFRKIVAVGKNLFAFFGKNEVVHIHFGMSGRWGIFQKNSAPNSTPTTRLTLKGNGIISHLSAMTVKHGDLDMFERKRSKLGQDPLDCNADTDLLWQKVNRSKKTISALLMDQSFFAGVGNIFRAEILFDCRMHPKVKGNELTRKEFNQIWDVSVKLMKIGYDTGRIVGIDPKEASRLGEPLRRRWVYNQSKCLVCKGTISNFKENSRTVWCCLHCQRKNKNDILSNEKAINESNVFHSKCAKESLQTRKRNPLKMTVAELKTELKSLGYSTSGLKKDLISRYQIHLQDMMEHTADLDLTVSNGNENHGYHHRLRKRKNSCMKKYTRVVKKKRKRIKEEN